MRRIWSLIILLFSLVGISKAQEENLIASAIYNFTRFIDWPDEGSANFYIDIIGHKSVYEKLTELAAGRRVGTRVITVRYFENINNLSTSQIVFLGFWQSKDISTVNIKTGDAHTLIISEKDGLIEAGAGINFVIRNNSIKFEIKRSNIVRHGLGLNSQLEQMAFKIY